MMNAQKTLDFKSNKFAISSWLWFLFGFFVWIFLFVCLFISHSWLLEFLHDFISSVFALMCYFLWFAAGGGSSCSPVLARKHKGDYFWKQIFNCITSWFFWGCFLFFFRCFFFFCPLPTSLSCWTLVFIHNCLYYQLSLIILNNERILMQFLILQSRYSKII